MKTKIYRQIDVELRESKENDMVVEGYALKWDKRTLIGSEKWGWYESISRNAILTANIDDVVLNKNHDNTFTVARTSNNTLKLVADDTGLKITAQVIDTQAGIDFMKEIRSGLINKMSFAVEVKKSDWKIDETGNNLDERTITEFGRFYDVSAVTFPAYTDTSISARNEIDDDAKQHINAKEYRNQMSRLNKILKKEN